MENEILKINNLSKQYKNFKALSNVSLSVKAGHIYGLIGQNGAGKTTLMRIICGFSYPTSGSIELFGKKSEKELVMERNRMGCMIEYPAFVPNLTAKENLTYNRMLRGIPNKEIEDEILAMVGLSDTKHKKAKDFSLGMKQRLGIGISLLGNPELLILDEPINGLDPVGVVEIRELLRKLCDEQQMTIIISSHNLPELYQTATDYIILHHGELMQEITLEELENQCKHHIKIQCNDVNRLSYVLEQKLHTKNYVVLPDHVVKLYDYIDDRELVAKEIFHAGLYTTNFSLEGDTLENYFISVIGGGKNE